MEVNLVGEALKFMALGMGIVFTFLIIMMFALKAQAAIIGKYFKEDKKTQAYPVPCQSEAKDNKKIVAAITSAIIHHNTYKG